MDPLGRATTLNPVREIARRRAPLLLVEWTCAGDGLAQPDTLALTEAQRFMPAAWRRRGRSRDTSAAGVARDWFLSSLSTLGTNKRITQD
jgi:hypothetical protein